MTGRTRCRARGLTALGWVGACLLFPSGAAAAVADGGAVEPAPADGAAPIDGAPLLDGAPTIHVPSPPQAQIPSIPPVPPEEAPSLVPQAIDQAAAQNKTPPPPPSEKLLRAPGAPPRTSIDEPVGTGAASQSFYLHNDNYFALQVNNGWPARVKFQVSVRFEMLSIHDVNNFGVSFAYTQKSFWDLFAFDRSSPFVESNYKPELFISYRPRRSERFRELQLGVQHESNGLGEADTVSQADDSRGWNYVFVEGRWGISRAKREETTWFYFTPGLRLWAPFEVLPSELKDTLGFFSAFIDVDLRIPEFPQISRVSARVRVQRHSVQASFYYPLLPFLSGGRVRIWAFGEIFHGEGERLITFRETVSNAYLGLGFQ